MVKRDLSPGSFPAVLNWKAEGITTSLEKLHEFGVDECKNAIEWYHVKKKKKRIFGYLFRVGAIFSITASGVIPVLSEIYKDGNSVSLSPAWATVALAFAALFIMLDKLGGHTSGWIRYMQTAQTLVSLQSNFRVEWEKVRIGFQDSILEPAAIEDAIKKCQDFLADVNEAVSNETDAWAAEFQSALVELDKTIKEKKGSSVG